MNIRLFVLAAISFGCGLVFQYSNVIEFDDYYASSEWERQSGKFRSLNRDVYTGQRGKAYSESMSDGRKYAVTIAYALGGISLIGGILITGLNKEKT